MENLERMKFVILLFTCNELLVISTDSLNCNFDDGLCSWRQDTHNDFNWTIWSGETPTPDTGPDSDHTSGEGCYVYIDTSEEENNKNARLISPKTSPGQYCFSLWYYMYGQHVRLLVLFTQKGAVKKRVSRVSGEQGQKWILQQTFIDTDEPFEIIIVGRVKKSGDHDLGDIAIDDIVMFSSNRCLADCGDPVPEFGFTDSKDIAIGSNVHIACQTGYKITGNPSIVCQANGTWSDSPVCHQVDCGIPTFNSEIIVQKFEGTTYNMSLVLDCSEGFTLIGNAYITCKDDGNWTTQPTCDINNCSAPSPEYGIVNSTSLQYGSVVKVTCIPGYKITRRSLILCQANSTWTDNPVCDPIDSETSAMVAIYVTIPLIVVVLAVLLTVIILRKRRAHRAKRNGGQHEIDMNPSIHFPNETYNEHALNGLNPTKRPKANDVLQPDDEYAYITDDEQADTTENVYYNTFDSECRIQKDTEHHYDHMKSTSKPIQDNTYSHMQGDKMDIEWNPSNEKKLISNNSNASLRKDGHAENNYYDQLDISNLNEAMKQEHSMTLNEEQESDYDHAKAGGIDPVPFEQDDYFHIRDGKVNQENTGKEMCIHDKYEYSNVTESTEKREKKGNERKAEYEQPTGRTPQYFVLEAENENTPEDDRNCFVLEAEEKNDETYESDNHTYFVLEKTESA